MSEGEQIVVLVPVYKRPERVQPLIESFRLSQADNARLLFIASPEDHLERRALRGIDHLILPRRRAPGDWARKINFGYRHTTEPWILCGADDIAFHRGWDRVLLRAAAKTRKRVLGTHDLNPQASKQGVYSPHPLVARSYADERGTLDGPGAIVCELYDHNYPDRELAATAIMRREWIFVREAVIEHLHPGWTSTRSDRTYRLGSRQIARDHQLYDARIRQWINKKSR